MPVFHRPPADVGFGSGFHIEDGAESLLAVGENFQRSGGHEAYSVEPWAVHRLGERPAGRPVLERSRPQKAGRRQDSSAECFPFGAGGARKSSSRLGRHINLL
jgi:hypothetical protein